MHINHPTPLALITLSLMLGACSSPPKPPTVDDSTKRPVNAAAAVDLQMCRSELSAAKIVLSETTAQTRAERALALPTSTAATSSTTFAAPPAPPPVQSTTATPALLPNHVFIIRFATGSADFQLGDKQQARFIEQARNARFIVIRGRTDAATDALDETHLARRRSEAAYNFLLRVAKLPPDGLRMSWQGAGDQADPGESVLQRQANRRVEIEMYESKPEVEILVG